MKVSPRNFSFFSLFTVLPLFFAQSGCVHELVNKYRNNHTVTTAHSRDAVKPATVQDARQTPSIYALNDQTVRFRLPYNAVWDGAIEVLLKNYNLTIVDEKSGLITTEWDSFYLDEHVYRNKVSMRVKKVSWDLVDVTIYNNVEVLQNAQGTSLSSVWLPTNQGPGEVGRILQNMAIALRQPAPVLPQEMMASGSNLEKNMDAR
jgi:hypothetical protein